MSGRPSLDFVVVGAQRAGSTHLAACLQDHPELYLCPDEVPYFEDPFFTNSAPSTLAAAVAGARPGQRIGIQRPEYLAREECPARIRAHSPGAVILAVLRDPVERAVSAWFWYVQFGRVPFHSLDAGIEALLDGRSDAAYPHGPEILEFGFYGRHLGRYFDQFGPDRVLVVLNDELEDPATFARIYRSLGVDPEHRPAPAGRALTNAGVYDRRRLRVLRARRRWAWSWDDVTTYTYRPRRRRRPLAFLPNAAVVAFDRVLLARLFGNERPRLRPDLEARLRAFYAPDVAVLESLLGRDLAAWKTPNPRGLQDSQ